MQIFAFISYDFVELCIHGIEFKMVSYFPVLHWQSYVQAISDLLVCPTQCAESLFHSWVSLRATAARAEPIKENLTVCKINGLASN